MQKASTQKSIRLSRRLAHLACVGILFQGLLGNCNPGTITTTTTTELNTAEVLQSLFRSVLIEPVVQYVDDQISNAVNNFFGTDNEA